MSSETELSEWKAEEKQDPDYVLAIKEAELATTLKLPPPKPKPQTTELGYGDPRRVFVMSVAVVAIALLASLMLVALVR